MLAKKMGFNDVRGTLFYEFARCVKEVHPKMFMAENVRGLLSHDSGRTLATIISVFEDLGYTIDNRKQVLNASYYGVGQKRERIVMVGIRNDVHTDFSYPKPEKKQTTLREALQNCPASAGVSYSEKNVGFLSLCHRAVVGLTFLTEAEILKIGRTLPSCRRVYLCTG